VFERMLPVARYREPQDCACGNRAEKVILHAPRVFGDYEGYESPASGKWIEGKRARQEDLARTGCRPYEDGEKEAAQKATAASEAELSRRVDAAVEQTLSDLTL
jgi:hypothetical protein